MNQKQIEIISIKKAKRQGFFILETKDDKINVGEDIIVKYVLLKGKILSEELYKQILEDNEKNNYYLKVCNYISFQMRSEREIIDYLRKFSLKESDIDTILKRLKNMSLINDDLLSKAILESTINNLKGPKAYLLKLTQRKISKDIKKPVYSKEIEEEVIETVIIKNKDKKINLPKRKQQEQLYSKLMRDGFSSELIESKLRNIQFIDESYNNLESEIKKLFDKHSDLSGYELKTKIINKLRLKGYDYQDIIMKLESLDE